MPDTTTTFRYRLKPETGGIYMRGRVREGEYNFQVKVYDVVWKRQVTSSVSVIIKEINDDAVTSSGSIRLQGGKKCTLIVTMIMKTSINVLKVSHEYKK